MLIFKHSIYVQQPGVDYLSQARLRMLFSSHIPAIWQLIKGNNTMFMWNTFLFLFIPIFDSKQTEMALFTWLRKLRILTLESLSINL